MLLTRRVIILLSYCCIVFLTTDTRFRNYFGSSIGFVTPSTPPPDVRPLVAIVCCIKGDSSLFLNQHLLPSIYENIIEEEWTSFRTELILGYDHDDEYWQQDRNRRLVLETIYNDTKTVPINFVGIRKNAKGGRPNRIPFNELCQAAYDYGATYIARINDDTKFVTPGWITLATRSLQSFSPPNVGVVGPTCRQGNTRILTHDFVHAPSHYSMFETYYPQEFDNWFVDDWITRVYGGERTRKLQEWEVLHFTKRSRYTPAKYQGQYLENAIKEGSKKVGNFVLEKKEWLDKNITGRDRVKRGDDLQMLGTWTIYRVDGPMQSMHLYLGSL